MMLVDIFATTNTIYIVVADSVNHLQVCQVDFYAIFISASIARYSKPPVLI